MNEYFWHGAVFLWQPQHLMSIGCVSNTVAMVTATRFLGKIIANLIDKIFYYTFRMNYSSLKNSQKLWFLTLFKCVLLNIEPNVVRSLLSAGDVTYHANISRQFTQHIKVVSWVKVDKRGIKAKNKQTNKKTNKKKQTNKQTNAKNSITVYGKRWF